MEERRELVKRGEVEDYERIAREYLALVGQRVPRELAVQFLQICQAFKLNPFKREIYLIPYGNQANIIVGYEVYLKRAERSGKLAGWKVWIEKDGDEIKACIRIKRKDWDEPFEHEVYLREYKRDTQIWREKPYTMLKKVAIAQGFRLAFPEELGGIPYTQDEVEVITQDEVEVIDVETGEVIEVREEKKEEKNEKVKDFVREKLKRMEGERKPVVEGKAEEGWNLEKIRNVASEELKKVVREYRVRANELIELFTKYDGDQAKIIEEIRSRGRGEEKVEEKVGEKIEEKVEVGEVRV